MKTHLRFSCLMALMLCLLPQSPAASAADYGAALKDLPFKMGRVARPSIPSRKVSVADFGAVGDGNVLNTEAFASAIAYLESKGGGHLVVPSGVWRTGPIALKSRMDLHVTPGAVIVFDPDPELYPVIDTDFEGLWSRRCESPISADGAHDVSISGGGVIDGSGEYWRPVKKSKLTPSQWKKMSARPGVIEKGCWYPDEGYLIAQGKSDMNVPPAGMDEDLIKRFLRPVMVSLRHCENVLLEDCLFQNSPAWCIHPLFCRNLIVDGIQVRNPAWSQNGDGIDVDSCTDVLIIGSEFDCGDDGICIKSGKDADGRARGVPCSNLVIKGCTVYSGHGGFVVGSEMSSGVKNIKISDCRFLGTDVGLRFKSKRGRGGVVENIWIDNISMKDIVTDVILFDLFYGGKSAVEAREDNASGSAPEPAFPVDETTPFFKNIHISNVVCSGADRAMLFNGLPEAPIDGITVSNCTISALRDIEIHNAVNVRLENVNVTPLSRMVVLSEMNRCPDGAHLDFMEGKRKWNYTTGLELKAFLDVYDKYRDKEMLDYVDAWYDAMIDDSGQPKYNYKQSLHSLDHVCPANTLFLLYDLTGKGKYRKAISALKEHIDCQPRVAEGAFWHKEAYPGQVWLDGVYMSMPFYANYTVRFTPEGERDAAWKDIVNEFKVAFDKTYDPATGLLRHAWDSTGEMPWGDGSGRSAHCWGRALGWYTMALVDVLETMPASVPGRQVLTDILGRIVSALPGYSDGRTGMWYQVMDQPGRDGNYLEATSSAMFVYSLLKGIRLGVLDSSLTDYARESYSRLLDTFVRRDESGLLNLDHCCSVAGLGGKEPGRDGSFGYYISEPVRSNDPKGIGPLVWAALETESDRL